jgi:hypothetical protein
MRTNLALFFISALLAAGPLQAAEESPEAAADPARPAAAPEKKPEPQITVKGVQGEEATKARLRADAQLARCVIKPVMTDEEIRVCKEAYRQPK